MLNSKNAILERKNYRISSSSTVRLTSLFENQCYLQVWNFIKFFAKSINNFEI